MTDCITIGKFEICTYTEGLSFIDSVLITDRETQQAGVYSIPLFEDAIQRFWDKEF